MAVRIVTDSTSDLDPEVARALGVEVVPLVLRFGTEEFLDGVEISAEEFYGRLATEKRLPGTSQPPAQAFADVYSRIGAEGHEIVSIHLSSKISGTLNSASVAREQVTPDVRVELIDSYSLSMGLGLIVEVAAKAAIEGAGFEEVIAVAKAAVGRSSVFVVIATTEYLRRGGRVSRMNALAGSFLNIKPMIQVIDGELVAIERIRTWKRAISHLEKAAFQDLNAERLHVATSGSPHLAVQFAERLRPKMPHTEFTTGYLGPAIGVHTGPGALGFCALARP